MDVAFAHSLAGRAFFRHSLSRNHVLPSPSRCSPFPLPQFRRNASSTRRRAVTACVAPVRSLRDKKAVITTPLFYVNASPHMGSAYPTIAADALSRFYRMAGAQPVLITGCDEHGEKIAAAAAGARQTDSCSSEQIQLFCDDIASEFDALWQKMEIQYDSFVRTTNPKHCAVVKEFMERVWKNGDIYKSVYEGMYCTGCEEYKDEKDLVDGDVCPIHLKPCENRKEENYFFALSKYQEKLETFLEENPLFVLPTERRNEVLGWVKSGLRDFSVSRANNPWGIPVPRDEAQTIYVWFDALLGYISGLLDQSDEPSLEAAVAKGWPADVHIIGKDILRFHAVYWPAMLMSAGLPLPSRVIGHGFITKDGMKMGKSLGNTLDPAALVDQYGSDAVRYYFLRAVDFGRDGDFSEQRFVDIVNADLANSVGNLVSRSLNLLKKNCGGILPISTLKLGGEDAEEEERQLRQATVKAAEDAYKSYIALDFVGAADAVMELASMANGYIDRVAPWKKFKSDDANEVEQARRCIVNVLELSRIVAAGLSPLVPGVSQKVYAALGLEEEFLSGLVWEDSMKWGRLEEGMMFSKPKPVFPRMEVVVAEPAVVA